MAALGADLVAPGSDLTPQGTDLATLGGDLAVLGGSGNRPQANTCLRTLECCLYATK